jgi:hypothetical protein
MALLIYWLRSMGFYGEQKADCTDMLNWFSDKYFL